MPRSRNIKPGFFDNSELGKLHSDIRLLYASLWTLSDREGVVEYDLAVIRRYVFGYKPEITEDMLNGYLTVITRLDNGRTALLKEYNDKKYLILLNFITHQNPHHTEKKGRLPSLETLLAVADRPLTVISPLLHRENPADSLIPDSLIPPKAKRELSVVIENEFEIFWDAYGYKVGKKEAGKAYAKVIKSGIDPRLILHGVREYQKDCQRRGCESKFFKHPSTWLNGAHWNDEFLEGAARLSDEDELKRIKQLIGDNNGTLRIYHEHEQTIQACDKRPTNAIL